MGLIYCGKIGSGFVVLIGMAVVWLAVFASWEAEADPVTPDYFALFPLIMALVAFAAFVAQVVIAHRVACRLIGGKRT
jgi:hypothetical protein